MQRRSGDVKLTLKENKRLNPNAPVYEIKKDVIDGMKTLVKKKHIPIEVRFMLYYLVVMNKLEYIENMQLIDLISTKSEIFLRFIQRSKMSCFICR